MRRLFKVSTEASNLMRRVRFPYAAPRSSTNNARGGADSVTVGGAGTNAADPDGDGLRVPL
jgi:hypothetical protein